MTAPTPAMDAVRDAAIAVAHIPGYPTSVTYEFARVVWAKWWAMRRAEVAPRIHDVFCNVGLSACSECGGWQSYCYTHREKTRNDRCTCAGRAALKETTHGT